MCAKYIMELRCFLVDPLKLLLRQSLTTGKTLEDWERGMIVPIYSLNDIPYQVLLVRYVRGFVSLDVTPKFSW